MAAIFRDPFLSAQLAIRGGTVLHKVHLAPAVRYSEDVDLVLVGDRPIRHIVAALRRVLTPVLGKAKASALATVQLAVRNVVQQSRVARLVYEYRPTVQPPSTMRIKIEVNYTERTPFYSVVSLPYRPAPSDGTEPVILRSYDLDEMLGTKMRALLQRTAGRDLFDLSHAWHRHLASVEGGGAGLVNPQRVVDAFLHYMRREGTTVTRDMSDRALTQKLRSSSFRSDMAVLLPSDISYDVDTAAATVRTIFLARLP